jgi:hypothetical protein
MEIQFLVDTFLRSLIGEFLKTTGQTNLGSLFANFTGSKLKEYLITSLDDYSLIKTRLLFSEPVELLKVYQPLLLKKNNIFIETNNFEELFKETNKITIIGRAGSGKSTLIQYLFIQSIKNKFKIPVIIKLRHAPIHKEIIDYIYEEINADDYKDQINKCLINGDFLILFDGYDENVSSNKKATIDRVNKITKFVTKYKKNKFVITTRPFSGAEHLRIFTNYNLCDLNKVSRDRFIEQQLTIGNDRDSIQPLISSADRCNNKFVRAFLKNPLLLTLYILTFRRFSTIPQKKYKFYSRVIEVLFITHDSLSKNQYPRPYLTKLNQERFEYILERLSFLSFCEGINEFDKDYLFKVLDYIKEDLDSNFPKFNNHDFLSDLLIHIPLLTEDDGILSFVHKSLQEYFCAVFIKNLSDDLKKDAFEILSDNLSEKYYYELYNFITIYRELDEKNYYKFFYIPSIEKIKSIYSIKDNVSQSESEVATLFLNFIIKDIEYSCGEKRNKVKSEFINFNRNISSTLFVFEYDFEIYERMVNLIYKFIESNYFCNKITTKQRINKKVILETIVSNKGILHIINKLLFNVAIRNKEILTIVESSTKSDKRLLKIITSK